MSARCVFRAARVAARLGAIGGPAALAGCGGRTTPAVAVAPATAASPDQRFRVAITNFRFEPKQLIVPVGTTVTWINWDTTLHSVTGVGDERFDSGRLGNRATYTHTFTKPGTYSYMCLPHPGMQGVIIVQ